MTGSALLAVEEDIVMSISFQCPSCPTLSSTSAEKPGSIVACPCCHKKMAVPHGSSPVGLPVPDPPVISAVRAEDYVTCEFAVPRARYPFVPCRMPNPLDVINAAQRSNPHLPRRSSHPCSPPQTSLVVGDSGSGSLCSCPRWL